MFKHISLFALLLASIRSAQLDPSSVGQQLEVIRDTTTKLANPDPEGQCVSARILVISYKYNGENGKVFYQISQCLDANGNTTKESVKFSYTGVDGSFQNLPEGCPYPAISIPPAPTPCENGFKMGQIISRTVANIVTPVLTSEDPNVNPEVETVEYQEIQTLVAKLAQTPDSEELHQKLDAAIKKYSALVKEYTDEKIKCFTEKVTPVKKIDIEFVCAQNGAYDTIEQALEAALGDRITCAQLGGCDHIQEALQQGQLQHSAFSEVDTTFNQVEESSYHQGVADFNNNYQIPNDNEDYILYNLKYNGSASKKRHLYQFNNTLVNSYDQCSITDDKYKVQFQRHYGNYYRIRSKTGGYFKYQDVDTPVQLDPVEDFETVDIGDVDYYLFKIMIQPNGGVQFVNKLQGKRTLVLAENVRTDLYDSVKDTEFLFIRKDCVNFV